MKHTIQAAAVVLLSASTAQAQQTAVQWRVQDGGNGHWYQWVRQPSGITWVAAEAECRQRGGHLATPTSPTENQFVFSLTLPTESWQNRFGPWLGGLQDASATGYSEPAGGWAWSTGEAWSWTAWWNGEPSNFYCTSAGEDKLHFIDYQPKWNDIRDGAGECEGQNWSYLIEWSADCNNDGIVDYGQILDGTFDDANRNGIPDRVCECLGDFDADGAITGADLGQLLAAWGASATGAPADLNADGVVDGADLGFLLFYWGPCSN